MAETNRAVKTPSGEATAPELGAAGASRRAIVIASIAAGALVVVGIGFGVALALAAGGPESVATVDASSPATPSPITTPSEPRSEAPAMAFGGDCSAVALLDELREATGSDGLELSEDVAGIGDVVGLSVQQLGGLSCWWGDGDSSSVSIVVLPGAVAGGTVHADAEPTCYGEPAEEVCGISVLVGGYWVSGVYYVADGSGLSAAAGLRTIVDVVGAAAQESPATAPEVVPGTWRGLSDCGELEQLDLAAITGWSEPRAGSPGVGGELPEGAYGALEALGSANCGVDGRQGADYLGAGVIVIPGAAWVLDDPAAHGEPVDAVDGAETMRIIDFYGSDAYAVSDGVNLLVVRSSTTTMELDEAKPLITPILRLLNEELR